MTLKAVLSGLLLAAPLAVAHPSGHEPVPQHAARPLKGRDLNHCSKRFKEPTFQKRFVEKNGDEFLRLRRSAGIEPHDRYDGLFQTISRPLELGRVAERGS